MYFLAEICYTKNDKVGKAKYKKSKQRGINISILLLILTMMSVGDAAFQTKVKVKGTTRITSIWDIRITNVTSGTAEISGNTATNSGGGVFVSSDATLSISSSAYIKNNTCSVSTSAGGVTWLGTVSGTKTHICGNTSFDYTDKSTSTKVTQACP